MQKLVLIFLLMIVCLEATAQQDPLYAQYLNNQFLVNPAYAGFPKAWQTVLGIRKQWVSLPGSPTTFSFTSSCSFVEDKVGTGLAILQDNIGETSTTDVSASYSYKLQLESSELYFGLLAGVVRYQSNPGELNMQDASDDTFVPYSRSQFNTGFGIIYNARTWFVGVSIPRMISNSLKVGNDYVQLYNPHVYLTGSYIDAINERMVVRSSMLLRAVKGGPVSVDVNSILVLNRSLGAGVLVRNLSAFGLIMQAWVKEFKFGYVFEVPTGRSVGAGFTTHEVTVTFTKGLFSYHTPDPL